jgi:hypothetical protein
VLQLPRFVIYGDPDSLKQTRKLRRSGLGAKHGSNGIHQIIAGCKRVPGSAPHDLAGKPSRPPLVSEISEQRLEFVRVGRVKQVRRRTPGAPHPHVQCSPRTEGKSSRLLVQLPGGHTEIQQNEVRTEGADGCQGLG